MEREGLTALEKRVEALRVLAAEKSVLARTQSTEPPRHHAEISTALLALVVFVTFLVGRELAVVMPNATCPSLPRTQLATVIVGTDTWSAKFDTDGNMERTGSFELHHPETVKRKVSPEAVRAIANRLAEGCFFEHQPPPTGIADGSVLIVTLRSGGREATYEEKWPAHPMPLCNGFDTLDGVAKTAMDLARVREELFDRL